jgi:hypothetical protein
VLATGAVVAAVVAATVAAGVPLARGAEDAAVGCAGVELPHAAISNAKSVKVRIGRTRTTGICSPLVVVVGGCRFARLWPAAPKIVNRQIRNSDQYSRCRKLDVDRV